LRGCFRRIVWSLRRSGADPPSWWSRCGRMVSCPRRWSSSRSRGAWLSLSASSCPILRPWR